MKNLVGQQHAGNGAALGESALGVNVLLPLEGVSKRVLVGQVKHYDAPVGVFVIHPSHPGEPLLTFNQSHTHNHVARIYILICQGHFN